MRMRERAALLALSLLLPLLAVGLLLLFTVGSVALSASDRAIVWAEATPSRLSAMEHRVGANEWFAGGRTLNASERTPLPTDCHPGARQFSFGGLREGEAQAAREILELMASEAGATVCLTNTYLINELPDLSRQHWIQAAASGLLSTSLLPFALVLAAYLSMAGKLQLGSAGFDYGAQTRALGAGVAAAIGVWLLLTAVSAASRLAGQGDDRETAMSVALVGPGLAVALILVVPMLLELAFRGWMLPLAGRAIGPVAAALFSSTAYAAASLPMDAWQAAGQFGTGMVLAGLYLRTRSLSACVLASVLVGMATFLGV